MSKKCGKLRRWFRVLKLRFLFNRGFKLTSDERSELAQWITRNVKEPSSETLSKLNGDVDEFGGKMVYSPYIPIFKSKIVTKDGLQDLEL